MSKSLFLTSSFLAFLITFLSSCQAIGDIFKAGVWSGIFIVVLIVAVVVYLISRSSKK